MAWQEKSTMSLRQEFVELARQEGAPIRALCRAYGISPKTAYKWLGRYQAAAGDAASLQDQSRRPVSSPARSADDVERAVIELRLHNRSWGGRKISRRLQDLGGPAVAPSTVTGILRRHGLIPPEAATPRAWERFEHEQPNSLWQMDYKGQFQTLQGPCHALTLLDDHSRFNLALHAHPRQARTSVQASLEAVFRRYGLPVRINTDNGSPWGTPKDTDKGLSTLALWLVRLGVRISFSRPYHPQTNGKLERFHRSLKAEVLAGRHFSDLDQVQRAFDGWRDLYNCKRPHEALQLSTPVQRYTPSPLPFPDHLAPLEYPESDTVLQVKGSGWLSFQGQRFRLSQNLAREPVGIRADPDVDGLYHVFYGHHRITQLDMRVARNHT
jgi:transposase InsO family protein